MEISICPTRGNKDVGIPPHEVSIEKPVSEFVGSLAPEISTNQNLHQQKVLLV